MLEISDIQLVRPSDLLLDPNNYRFYDMPDYRKVDQARYDEEGVQRKTQALLRRREEDLVTLKASILRNGYVRFEAIVIAPYGDPNGPFIVIEGNRRVAAVKWILEDHTHAIPVPEKTLKSVEHIPAIVAPANEDDRRAFVSALMGMRHVSGAKEWGAYQQALLVAQLRDGAKLTASEAADTVGLHVREANRRYRALRALQQMEQDEEYADQARPALYAMFHEAVAIPDVRQWLGWSDEEFAFGDSSNRSLFYEWLVGAMSEDESECEPKLATSRDVRNLTKVLGSPEALAVMRNPEGTLAQALAEVESDEGGRWVPKARAALRALKRMSADELENLGDPELLLLEQLREATEEQLRRRARLTSTD